MKRSNEIAVNITKRVSGGGLGIAILMTRIDCAVHPRTDNNYMQTLSASDGKRGFRALNIVQFLGAANDNVLKQFITFAVALGGIWAADIGSGGKTIAGLCLTIPFVLFSGFAGQFADRYSKSKMTILVKLVEVLVAILATAALVTGNVLFALAVLTVLGLQSTFFGPAKYGMLPELVGEEGLSKANGVLSMLTNIAVILGAFAAGPLYDSFASDWSPVIVFQTASEVETEAMIGSVDPVSIRERLLSLGVDGDSGHDEVFTAVTTQELGGAPLKPRVILFADDTYVSQVQDQVNRIGSGLGGMIELRQVPRSDYTEYASRNSTTEITTSGFVSKWLPGIVMLIIAVTGLAAALKMPYLRPMKADLPVKKQFLRFYLESIKSTAGTPLLAAAGVSSVFYIIPGVALLALSDYGEILGISRTKAGYLLAILSVGIGIGGVLVGLVSGTQIKPRLILYGAMGMTVAFAALGLVPNEFAPVAIAIAIAGVSAGFFLIPLLAIQQSLAPDNERGRFLGFVNAAQSAGFAAGAVFFWVLNEPLGLASNETFFGCAAVTLLLLAPLHLRWIPWFSRSLNQGDLDATADPISTETES